MMRQSLILIATLALGLGGCGVVDNVRSGGVPDSGAAVAPVVAVAAPVPQRLPGTAGGQSAAALDTTTEAERAAAVATGPAKGAVLGKVRVSLGNPADAGFWLQGGIVTTPGKGRVTAASGQSVAVELRPGVGAAQLSLPAFRALGLNLTDLPEVTVGSE
ncbi:MAG: hypothetical protein CFE34_10015 [Rhodobacteraceae bacterium PARR1]|nr:MAG: hypothetical protein CFE34_10015 [Rhodobacteraceae bacterium PARR1]